MARVPSISTQDATGEAKELLTDVTAAFGVTPAMFRAVANSPAALKMMWSAFGALGGGRLPAKLGEQIAVLVADRTTASTAWPPTPPWAARPARPARR